MAAGLTPKQKRFCEQYLVDLNATQAARRAGYSPRSASELGYQLLQNPSVQRAVERMAAERSKRTAISSDIVLQSLLRIAQFDPLDIFRDDGSLKPLSRVPREVREAIAGLKFKGGQLEELKLPDKVRPYEMLCRHLGLLTDVIHHGGDVTVRERIARGRRRAMGRRASETEPES